MSGDGIAYFLTWTTYGSWLHGDPRGSVDHSREGPVPLARDDFLAGFERRRMANEAPILLNEARRAAVEFAIGRVCEHRGWSLVALNVRTNHVHAVVRADEVAPERVLNDFKVWSTRRMREEKLVGARDRIWTRHGSTRRLWTDDDVVSARAYVLHGQGNRLPGTEFIPPDIES